MDIPPDRCLCIRGSHFYELLSFLKFLYLWTMQHLKFSILQMRKCYQERDKTRHLSAISLLLSVVMSGERWAEKT